MWTEKYLNCRVIPLVTHLYTPGSLEVTIPTFESVRFCKKVTSRIARCMRAIDVWTRGFVHVPVGTLFFKHPQISRHARKGIQKSGLRFGNMMGFTMVGGVFSSQV